MDLNFKRRARERRIAAEVANELFHALRPAMNAGADAQTLIDENRGLIAHIFGMACDRHQLATEAEATRVFAYIQPALADLARRAAHLSRQIESATAKLDGAQRRTC
jgi:hypothetical protein